MAMAIEFERAAKLAMRGELTEQQTRKILSAILEQTESGETLRCPTVGDFLREWLAGKESSKAVGTAVRYAKVITEFLAHLGERARRPLSSVSPRNIESFVTKRLKEGLAPSTVTLDAKILRAAFNLARRQGLIPSNPAEAVELPGMKSVERGTFSGPEVKMLLDAAQGEWRTLILIGYYTGQRLSDCTRMAWADLDLAAGTWSLRQGKTDARLVVPIHPELLRHLEALAGTDSAAKYIMPHMAQLGPGGRHGLSEGFKRVARKAGVDTMPVQGGGTRMICRRSFHALRHSFTSALLNAGVSPELRMKLTGHKSPEVHRGYSHAELDTLRAAISKLPGLTDGAGDA